MSEDSTPLKSSTRLTESSMPIERGLLSRITLYVAIASAGLAALTFALVGAWAGFGALAGGCVAVANWYGMRWLGERLLRANDRGRMIWGSLLAVKMAAVLGLVWAILATGFVDPLGFAIGMSGFVLGILAGGFQLALSGTLPGAAGSAPDAAGQEK